MPDDLDEDDDDLEDEDEDEDDDDGDEPEHEKLTKSELLNDIADILGDQLEDADEVNVKDEDEAVLMTMSDGSVWKITLRQVKEAE
jgi:hypothetical protein